MQNIAYVLSEFQNKPLQADGAETLSVYRYFLLPLGLFVTSLNFSYDLVTQVVQGPRALFQRPVTGTRQKGRYEWQVRLPPCRRQGHGGPLKTKLHPPQTHSLLLSLSLMSVHL